MFKRLKHIFSELPEEETLFLKELDLRIWRRKGCSC